MRKIINISIFAVAGLAALLVVLFGFGFDQEAKDKYFNTAEINASNPQMLSDLADATVETLPLFIATYEEDLIIRSDALKLEKKQKDIFYTYLYHLEDLTTVEKFDAFKSAFPQYALGMFAKAENKESFVNGFANVTYDNFDNYQNNLKSEYEIIRQNYLVKSTQLKAMVSLLKTTSDINSAISVQKKEYDLTQLQQNTSSYKLGASEFSIAMFLAYVLSIVAFGAMLIFILFQIFGSIKENIGALAGVAVLLIVFVIGYFIASPELSPSAIKMGHDNSEVKVIGAGLLTFYFVFAGTILLIIVSIIMNAIKKAI